MKRFVFSIGTRVKSVLTMVFAMSVFAVANAQVDPSPTIGGAVFGGGRMADVNGNTTVTVINCDTISAVYGGNDIAGTVGGTDGSTIQIGTSATDALIRIGSVYGGGNGYYIYGGGSEFTGATSASFTGGVKAMDENGEPVGESFLASGTIPSILKTSITILPAGADADHVQRVRIGELFGGAKNAFVTATSDNSTEIVINGGTIYAVFGGNNYGGTLGAGSTHSITLNNSTTTNTENVANGSWTGFGREWGIRYLYGGGNKVEAQNVVISMTGGQVDTLFAGGNSADLALNGTAEVTINCGTPSTLITSAIYNGSPWTGDPAPYVIDEDYTWNTKHVYNVRTLFGGNNAAAMRGLPTLNLTAGHIGTVYGGGNAGAMLAKRDDAFALTSGTAKLRNDADYDADKAADASYAEADKVYYSTRVHVGSSKMLIDYLYGGCQKSDVEWSTWVRVEDGHIGTVYGGCNISGDVGSKHSSGDFSITNYSTLATADRVQFNTQIGTYVEVSGGKIYGNVFAGSNGYYHCNDEYKYIEGFNFDDEELYYIGTPIPTHNETHVRVFGNATIYGDLYAGANLANVGFTDDFTNVYRTTKQAEVRIRHSDTEPGWGDGDNNFIDSTLCPFPVTVGLASLRMGANATVMSNVYGGSNMAMIHSATDVVITGGTIIGALYGGNDKTGVIGEKYNNRELTGVDVAKASDTKTELTADNASSYLLITGKPKIGTVYGGGNGAYDYDVMNVCTNNSGDVVQPIQKSTFVDVHIDAGDTTGLAAYLAGTNPGYAGGGYIGRVFGGGNGVSVYDNITVLFNLNGYDGGTMDNDNVGTIFGGNDKGHLSIIPQIVLLKGQVHDVYGGCNRGDMLGKGKVTVYDDDANELHAYGNVGSYVQLSKYYYYNPTAINTTNRIATDASVSGSVYGGCCQADVGINDPADEDGLKRRSSLVIVESGDNSKARIFGGNDISGTVTDTARVVLLGTGIVDQIYGGGNGDYIYNNDGTVYQNHEEVADGIFERPFCSNTEVILEGGQAKGNVYAGGLAGNCGDTRLLIEGTCKIDGQTFGGGRGDVSHIGIRTKSECGVERVGNVTGTAVTELVSCHTDSKMKRAYGGGHNGDCANTRITLTETFLHPLNSIYGGCVASNVSGTANVTINGFDNGNTRCVDTLYGGNDYSGLVQNTVMTVNSGRFLTAFGAGNGDYDYSGEWSITREGDQETLSADEPMQGGVPQGQYIKANDPALAAYNDDYTHLVTEVKVGSEIKYNHSYRYWNLAEGCLDTVPYSMNINFTVNDGTFLYSVYGGGNMGLVGNRDMVSNDMHKNDADRGENMGLIVLNVHGGKFQRHIFTGASGRPGMKGLYFDSKNFECDPQGTYDPAETSAEYAARQFDKGMNIDGTILGKQLVYGLKIFNMDGGKVEFSVYGGSESVDDGYPYECIGRKNPNLYTGFPHHRTLYLKNDGKTATDDPSDPLATQFTYVPGDSNSTMRPSSILNIVGGIVEKSIYGGGYQGNIYGSVYVNIGRDAVNDSPVWTKEYGTDGGSPVTFAAYKPNLTNLSGVLDIPGRIPLTTGQPLMLNTSVYNASDWGEARDNPYFNTRGVFGGETNILIDGRGYRTTLQDQTQTLLPSMNIAYSIIGSGTSTEGGDIHRLITFRHYGDYYNCPNISKDLFSIQRADKVILDSVFINLNGEQDAFSAYASPDYSFCRIDTLLFRNDNIVSINAPGIYVGHLVSMKDPVEVVDFSLITDGDPNTLYDRNKLYTNFEKENTTENGGRVGNNVYSNDLLDNLYNLNSPDPNDDESCGSDPTANNCQDFPICARLRSERGQANWMGAYNTLVLKNGSYLKVNPYIDMLDDDSKWWVDPTGSGMNGKDDPAHQWGHVHGWMYLVAFDNTQSYVYADTKKTIAEDGVEVNVADGGFVATCNCDNYWSPSTDGRGGNYEIDYTPVDADVNVPQPYRIWRVGKNQGTRKRQITLIANAKPDNTLNYEVTDANTCVPIVFPQHGASSDCSSGTNSFHISSNSCSASYGPTSTPEDVDGYSITYDGVNGSQYSYAVTTLELPPSSPGNFYIMTPPLIDLDNGGQLRLTDQVYESQTNRVFQAEDLWQVDASGNLVLDGSGKPKNRPVRTPMSAILDDPNYTFGLAFSTTAQGSNFSSEGETCWMEGMNASQLTTINNEISRHATSRDINSCSLCWPYSYISGNEYLSKAGGFVSKAVSGGEGSIPTMTFTLTYNKNLTTTITRDITFTFEEYTATGEYVGPVDVTVTINTVIKEMDDLEAPVLAMYNEGITNEYIRKVTIPASFVQRDLYLEGFSWDVATGDPADRTYFNLQDTNNLYINNPGSDDDGHIKDNKTFAVVVNPTESSSEHLTNHLGWYHIERRNIDVFAEAYKDRTNNTYGYYDPNGSSDPSWPASIDDFKQKVSASTSGRSDLYNSFDYRNDGDVTTDDTTAIGTKKGGNRGIQIGTLDGRATASVDVRLLFDGLRIYRDYFPDPLGEIRLKMHWYNNKISREDIEKGVQTDGTFDIIIKLRTRAEGDTIYMAWGDKMMKDVASCKARWFYIDGNRVEQEVEYDGNNDPIIPGGLTQDDLYNKYHDYIQRNVTNAEGNPISATPDECIATVHSYAWQCVNHHSSDSYSSDLYTDRANIYNNPDCYLTNFEDVMKIYQEGDVIDIMQTIPINGGEDDVAQAISGTDYSIIQIIRYSGSHFKFPSLGCANYDPLVDVMGVLNMRNVWFNGSGCTRTKTYMSSPLTMTTSAHPAIMPEGSNINEAWRPNPSGGLNRYEIYNKETHTESENIIIDGYTHQTGIDGAPSPRTTSLTAPAGYYNEYPRDRVMLPVHAPMIYIHEGGSCNFSANVRLTNNINVGVPEHTPWYYDSDDNLHQHTYTPTTYRVCSVADPIPGGAIALIKDDQYKVPSLQLGHRSTIYGNTVINPYTTGTNEVNANGQLNLTNSGAGIYVYRGDFTIGSPTTVSKLSIEHNYYLKATENEIKTAADNVIVSRKVAYYTDDNNGSDVAIEIKYFELDTLDHAGDYYTLNNVYLTRSYNHNIMPKRPVRVDKTSDVVKFRGSLTGDTKIGITKWFPGYIYNNGGAYKTNNYSLVGTTYTPEQFHVLYDSIPRDTIGFAILTSGSSVVASYVYDSAAFFNDSVYFARNNNDPAQRSFTMNADPYLVQYAGNQTANPNFKDHVYIFHHDYLNPNRIYFQRCASFGKGVKQHLVEITETDPTTLQTTKYTINDYMRGDSIAYWWNKDATCVASTDTIVFRVGGGFFPYTYHWDMDSIVFEKGETLTNYAGSALGSGTSSALALKRIPVHDRVTFGTNAIANLSSARFDELRAKARIDTLVLSHLHMNQQLIKSTYLYEATATDLTGRCPVSQTVMVRVGKITSSGRDNHKGDYYVDSVNFLRHRNPYAAYVGYKDDYSTVAGEYQQFLTSTGEFVQSSPLDLNLGTTANEGAARQLVTEKQAADGKYYYFNDKGEIESYDSELSPLPAGYTQMYNYLYYRLNAPGVDSSSFHDHVDNMIRTTVGEDETRLVFLNNHFRHVVSSSATGFTVRSQDYLIPYIRPLVLSKVGDHYERQVPTVADVDYSNPSYTRRDTLGYELRHFDSVYSISGTDTTLVRVNMHRHLWNKVASGTAETGVYTWTCDIRENGVDVPRSSWTAENHFVKGGYDGEADRLSEDFYPVRHVPHHTHGSASGLEGEGGIRRAGYSHVDMHWYNHGFNRGTLDQRIQADLFAGKPYHDETMMSYNGLNNVKYVEQTAGGEWIDDATERSSTLYASEMVPRYLRIYRSYKVTPHIEPAFLGYDRNPDDPSEPSGEGAKVWGWETYENDLTEANMIDLSKAEFCPGGIVKLTAAHVAPSGSDLIAEQKRYRDTNMSVDTTRWEYIGWDFDPSSEELTNFVVNVNPDLNHPTVYYGPKDYWYQTVTEYEDEMTKAEMEALRDGDATQKARYARTAFDLGYVEPGNVAFGDYHEDYNGNMTIYTKKGLAWLISKVNGFNGMNARTFRFNTITLDLQNDVKADGTTPETTFDMSAHKWTPLGNAQNNFEGLIVGVDGADKQVVENIIVNERNLPFVGMFGYTDHARIRNFKLQNSMLRGNMYVGGLIGQSIDETEVKDMELSTNILFGEYVIGGAIAKAVNTTVDQLNVKAPIMYGNAIYAGGGIGTMSGSTVDNSTTTWYDGNQSGDDSSRVRNLSAVFFNGFHSVNYGGMIGNNDNPTSGGKSNGSSSVSNNYVQIRSGSSNLRVGGLIGSAQGISLKNNYVYGDAKSSEYVGGLAGYVGNDVSISNCYYVNGMTGDFVGNNEGETMVKKSTTFKGSGNAVHTTQSIDGIDNLTRILNKWVDQTEDSVYLHWRSDLDGVNNGYPIFGTPDLIPVSDSLETAACDELEWDGISFTESGRYVFHVIDSSEYIDSTFILLLTVNQSDTVYVSDTITIGEGYEGYGFTVSDGEVRDEMNHDGRFDIRTIIRMDSLYNSHGCDSVVILTLYVLGNGQGTPEVQKLADVKVYPNPTLGIVNVEGSDLQSVEVYDNISRRVLQYKGFSNGDNSKYVFDLSDRAAGAYYVRVRTANGTVVKKVIKK